MRHDLDARVGAEREERLELGRLVQSLQEERRAAEAAGSPASLKQALDHAIAERDRIAGRHDRLLRAGLVGYATTTLDGRIVFCNDALAEMLGYGDPEAFASEAGAVLVTGVHRRLIEAGMGAAGQVFADISHLVRPDGSSIRVSEAAMIGPMLDEAEALVERIVISLGPSTELEERLRSAQRLGEAGLLASDMSPDVEALVDLVDTCVAEMRRTGSSASGQSADVLAASAAGVVPGLRQLAAFSRKQARRPEPVDLNVAVERIEPLLARLVGPHIAFSLRLGSSTAVTLDSIDFDHMVTALFVAARDVLPFGGSIAIATALATPLRPEDDATPAAQLSVIAEGLRMTALRPSPALHTAVERCEASLDVGSEQGRRAAFTVRFKV
jgi:PAS domain-containing protein